MSFLSPEPRTLRSFFAKRLSQLARTLGGVRIAGIATEDGLMIATAEAIDPSPDDRQAAVLSSLTALARTAVHECGLRDARYVMVPCAHGVLLVMPFTTEQDSGAKRRLLYVVLEHANDMDPVLSALHSLIADVQTRLTAQG